MFISVAEDGSLEPPALTFIIWYFSLFTIAIELQFLQRVSF